MDSTGDSASSARRTSAQSKSSPTVGTNPVVKKRGPSCPKKYADAVDISCKNHQLHTAALQLLHMLNHPFLREFARRFDTNQQTMNLL